MDCFLATDVVVSNCTDGSWCPGTNNAACCAEHTGVFLIAHNETVPAAARYDISDTASMSTASSTTSSSFTHTASSAATTSPTTFSSVGDDTSSSQSSGGSDKVKLGVGIGMGGFVALILVLLGWYFVRRHQGRQRKHISGDRPDGRAPLEMLADTIPVRELAADTIAPRELAGEAVIVAPGELSADVKTASWVSETTLQSSGPVKS